MRQNLVSRCQELASRYPSPRNFTARRLVEEGIPIAGIFLFWGFLGLLGLDLYTTVAFVMAGFYVIVRGVTLTPNTLDDSYSFDVIDIVRENVAILPAFFAWIAAGELVTGILDLLLSNPLTWQFFDFRGLPPEIRYVFPMTALGIVALYVIANGIPLVRHYSDVSPDSGTSMDGSAESGSDLLGE